MRSACSKPIIAKLKPCLSNSKRRNPRPQRPPTVAVAEPARNAITSSITLADIGGYVCVLSHAGPDALSVTVNLNINFMRKAEAGPIDGHCRILKLGKSLMVFDIDIVAGADRHMVAHATGTYSIPPKR